MLLSNKGTSSKYDEISQMAIDRILPIKENKANDCQSASVDSDDVTKQAFPSSKHHRPKINIKSLTLQATPDHIIGLGVCLKRPDTAILHCTSK
jgi:hypothetical protein